MKVLCSISISEAEYNFCKELQQAMYDYDIDIWDLINAIADRKEGYKDFAFWYEVPNGKPSNL